MNKKIQYCELHSFLVPGEASQKPEDCEECKKLNLLPEPENYYTKQAVYGDDPLMEIIYEIEDCLFVSEEWEGKKADHEDLKEIFERHTATVREYKARIEKIVESRAAEYLVNVRDVQWNIDHPYYGIKEFADDILKEIHHD